MGPLAEDVAAAVGQRQRGGIAIVDAHQDLRLGVEPGRVARVDAERRLAVFGREEVGRHRQVEAGAEQPPGELVGGNAEIVQGDGRVGRHPVAVGDAERPQPGKRAARPFPAMLRTQVFDLRVDVAVARAGENHVDMTRIGLPDGDAGIGRRRFASRRCFAARRILRRGDRHRQAGTVARRFGQLD